MASFERINEIISEINRAYYDGGGLEGVNRLLGTIVVENLDIDEMVAYMRTAYVGSEQMPNHAKMVAEVREELTRRGETPERVTKLLKGLER